MLLLRPAQMCHTDTRQHTHTHTHSRVAQSQLHFNYRIKNQRSGNTYEFLMSPRDEEIAVADFPCTATTTEITTTS